jgi:hypothetical protein
MCPHNARSIAEMEKTVAHLAGEFRALVREMEQLRYAHRLGTTSTVR